MAAKKPTAKQLAARKRFAEMARSGAFKRKANAKKGAAPKVRKTARKAPPKAHKPARKPARKTAAPRAVNRFVVQLKRGASWVSMGGHPTQEKAVSAAKALHRVAPHTAVRVIG